MFTNEEVRHNSTGTTNKGKNLKEQEILRFFPENSLFLQLIYVPESSRILFSPSFMAISLLIDEGREETKVEAADNPQS